MNTYTGVLHKRLWDEILINGIIEYIDKEEEDTMAENDIIEQHTTSPQHKFASSEASTSDMREKKTSRFGGDKS